MTEKTNKVLLMEYRVFLGFEIDQLTTKCKKHVKKCAKCVSSEEDLKDFGVQIESLRKKLLVLELVNKSIGDN